MNASSLMNINTVKKYIKKGVPWVVSISFVDLGCLVRHLNSNNFQPLSNGFLSNETDVTKTGNGELGAGNGERKSGNELSAKTSIKIQNGR